MKPAVKQAQFAEDLGRLLTDGLALLRETYPDATLRIGEGYVGDSHPKTGKAVHRRDGGHFKRLAIDLMLNVGGQWITSSTHPAWQILHTYWKSLNAENGSGGAKDMNHFGRLDGGVY